MYNLFWLHVIEHFAAVDTSKKIRFRYSYFCQDSSTRRQWRGLFGLRVKLPPVTTSLTAQR